MSLSVSIHHPATVMPSPEHHSLCYLSQLKGLRDAAISVKRRQSLRKLKALRNAVVAIKQQKHKRQARRDAIQYLKDQELFQQVSCALGNQRTFSFHQLDELASHLNQVTILTGWTVQVVGNSLFTGVLVQVSYQDICPTIVFTAKANGFERQSFHFDYQE